MPIFDNPNREFRTRITYNTSEIPLRRDDIRLDTGTYRTFGAMEMRGRKPELKTYDGGLAGVHEPPEWLPESAKLEWLRIMPDLMERRILTSAMIGVVEKYCLLEAQIRQCQELLIKEEPFVQSATSAPRPHPAFRLMHEAMRQSRQFAAELGLTPMSRSRVGLAGASAEDESMSPLEI